MRLKLLLLFPLTILLLIGTPITIKAAGNSHAKGVVMDMTGQPLPFSTVYVKNSTYGVHTNLKGAYFIELKEGTHTLVFNFIGYTSVEKTITVAENQPKTVNVKLKQSLTDIAAVEVVLKPRKAGRGVVRKAIEKRREYLNRIETYECETYLKSSLKKETPESLQIPDSVPNAQSKSKFLAADMKKMFSNEKLNLLESISNIYFKKPGQYKQVIKGHHDYSEKEESNTNVVISYQEDDVIPEQNIEQNPYIVYKDVTSGEFNFYKNSVKFPAVCQKPILSPIASTAMLSYNYEYDQAFIENGKKIYKVKVIPRFNTEALFYGYIYIEDSTWALVSVDLSINQRAMYMCKNFQVIQNYELMEDQYYVPVRREFSYTIQDGILQVMGNTRVHHENYKFNQTYPKRFFGNELIRFEDDAFDKDSTYWQEQRPIQLAEDELQFVERIDSIEEYYASDEYFAKQDSIFNKINWWSLLNGLGHRNRPKGTEWWINGLWDQINLVGIGGYRHMLSGNVSKEFKESKNKIEADGFIDYGFRNKDVKGEIGVGFNYKPLKFMRTYVRVGDAYDMINNYESIEASFRRSNYVRKKIFSVSQRMEVVNGLFVEGSFNFSDQIPINNIELSNWSNSIFGAENAATQFVRYKKSEAKLEVRYRPKQKYIIKKGKKLLLGSKYPEFAMQYRKGFSGLFGSEVNYDYLELSAKDDIKLKRMGSSRWKVSMGTYLNESDLRLLEYKFFRGSDSLWFSDPIQSFQLLPRTMNTNKEWFSANFIHHFEGSIISKIPILNKMKLQLAAGTGTLLIRDANFAHFEMFAGVERPFRIKKELFRMDLYAVTSSNTIQPGMDLRFKFGITYYNAFTQKWGY